MRMELHVHHVECVMNASCFLGQLWQNVSAGLPCPDKSRRGLTLGLARGWRGPRRSLSPNSCTKASPSSTGASSAGAAAAAFGEVAKLAASRLAEGEASRRLAGRAGGASKGASSGSWSKPDWIKRDWRGVSGLARDECLRGRSGVRLRVRRRSSSCLRIRNFCHGSSWVRHAACAEQDAEPLHAHDDAVESSMRSAGLQQAFHAQRDPVSGVRCWACSLVHHHAC